MNALKVAFILSSLQIFVIAGYNTNLQKWQLVDDRLNKSMEKAVIEYFETKTRTLSVAISLEYSNGWKFVIYDYLLACFKGTESLTFEIFQNRYQGKGNIFNYNLWYVDSYKAFSSLLPKIGSRFVQKMGHYMIIMSTAKHLQVNQEMHQIFERAFQRNIVDIAIGIYVGNSTFIFYTYDIFLPQQCRQVVPRKFNMFQYGHLESAEFFPYKLGNFHKCPIDMVIRGALPYFGYNLTTDQKGVDHFWGMQAPLLRTMADKLNFELRIHPWNKTISGMVYDNGTALGHFQALREKQFDVVIGYYLHISMFLHFGSSIPYFMTPIVVILPKYKEDFIEGRWLCAPFSQSVWLSIILLVAIGMAIVFVLHYNLHIRHLIWLDAWGVVLGNARTFQFYFTSTRYIVIFCTFGFMILAGTFQGKLYEAFNSKPRTGPLSVPQLIAENYTFLIKDFVTPDLIKALQIPAQQIENLPQAIDETTFEKMLSTEHPVAMITNYWHFKAFVRNRRLYGEYDIVPHVVVMNQIAAFMEPQSYLIEPLNQIIISLGSGGIIKKWMLDEAGVYGTSNDVDTMERDKSNPEPKALSIKKIRLVFMGMAIMYIVAFMVFLGEVIVHMISNKWKRSQVVIRGRRQ